jgi:glutamyl-tRNA synthetase
MDKAVKIAGVMKERVTFPQDFWEQGKFFFHAPAEYDQAVVVKKWNEEAVKVLAAFRDEVKTLASIDAATAKAALEKVTAALGIGTGKILQALRLSLTGAGGGPDLMMIMEIIGKDEIVQRIDHAIKTLKVKVA